MQDNAKCGKAQDAVFAETEGNAWFRRNAAALSDTGRGDPMLDMVGRLSPDRRAAIRSICDIGCASAERLNRLRTVLPNVARPCGFDASAEAVAAGSARFPDLILRQGLAGDPPFDGPFDLVTIGFVLHWVDRRLLARTIAAIDSLLAEGGTLILTDFLPDRPCARRYHHRDDVDLFTYKQDYARAFTGLGLYREVARVTFDHSDSLQAASPSHDQERAVCAMLVRTCDYPEIAA